MSALGIQQTIDEIADEFAFLSDWEERYAYLIDMARALPQLPETLRTEAVKVRGCASQVWLVFDKQADGRISFRGDSDAHLVRGLIAVLTRVFSGRAPAEILEIDPRALFERLGLADALTPQRSNGLFAMMQRIRAEASFAG
ncbi:sulfur acceptor protein SufE [alpha proteobacterium U9-1i]|nr:sulfur acceptor protein SufE [alpha proteobacterium U9-1i]